MDAVQYLLDTNIVIYAQKRVPAVLERLRVVGKKAVAIPALAVAELAYGVEKSSHQERNRKLVEQLLEEFTVLPWTQDAKWHYARHYHRLRVAGKPIGHIDLLIAAQALALGATLVTNNTREFARIEGLRLEDWTLA